MPLFFKPRILRCNYCGYSGEFKKWDRNLYKCPSCDVLLDFGFSNDEQNLLSHAQSTLRLQEFAQSEELFADILDRYPGNHEARWGYVCARYGIKYEEDYNGERIPTCCLDSISSFKEDADFKKAVADAPDEIAKWYTEQADYVERISRKWMEEASREKPCDIFICFKDSDKENGIERTKDSYDAGDLYAWLTKEGYNVFFSRISLADKAGEKFEPFIFNALQTAKVLIVFGSRIDYIQSTWMKNEWHRYCKRISLGQKKESSLLVVYKNLNPASLPSILASKQCLDFSSNQFYLQLKNYLDGFFKAKSEVPVRKPEKESAAPTFVPIVETARQEKKAVSSLHEHFYTATVVPGTCITRGYTVHTCECGDEYKDSFTPLGEHRFSLSAESAPTCDENGKKEYICSVCAEKKTDILPAKGHIYDSWLTQTPPGCEKEGSEARQCKTCGHVETKPLPAKGHTFTDWKTSRPDAGKEEHFCTGCGKTEQRTKAMQITPIGDTKADSTVTFGSYPQSKVTSSALISTLNSKAGKLPKNGNDRNWTSYGYYRGTGWKNSSHSTRPRDFFIAARNGSQSNSTDYMWYIDVTEGTERYRGVYFTSYRPQWTSVSSSSGNSYQDDNGYTRSQVYWFKYEPLKWRILTQSNGQAMLLCESIIDSQAYQNEYEYKNDDYYIKGTNTYANNYAESTIRKWLNETFYNTAFSEAEKAFIRTTTVDNSARSTNPDSNANLWNSGTNAYACENTSDKIFLLSEQEVTKGAYGFSTDYSEHDTARQRKATDYAQSQGCDTTTGNYAGRGSWWLRSPTEGSCGFARGVSAYGCAKSNDYVFETNGGVVPALWIPLQ